MLRVFNKLLSGQTLFPIQNKQYAERIPLSDSVTAGETKLCKTNVSFIGHFLCQFITGNYQTLCLDTGAPGGAIVDDGICHLKAQLIDGAGSRQIFSDFVPLDLLFSPGRIKSPAFAGAPPVAYCTNTLKATATANQADPAPALFYPTNLEYLFTANSDIQMYVKNDSDTTITFNVLFAGIRVLLNK